MSYKEIIDACKEKGFTPKSSYIAHVKNLNGKPTIKSPARKGDYKYPCPDKIRPKLEKIMKKLGTI